MNNLDLDYQNLLKDILENGVEKNTRNGKVLSVFGRQIRHKMSDGFPLLTTKKMFWKGIVTELLWFLRGDTNIKFLVDNDCHIWDGDAYKRYHTETMFDSDNKWLNELDGMDLGTGEKKKVYRQFTQEEFINKIKTDDEFAKKWGELGPVYGAQWRGWTKVTQHGGPLGSGGYVHFEWVDQIANLIHDLKTNPDSRRLLVSAWAVHDLPKMVLPPCHYGFQVYTRELSLEEKWEHYSKLGLNIEINGTPLELKHMGTPFYPKSLPTRAISLMWNQRSVDTFLGLPFNIASYGLLLEIIAKEVNMVPDELIGNLGDTHLYLNHIEQAKEQIGRELNLDERAKLHPTPEMFYDISGTFSISNSIENSNMPDKDRAWLHEQFDRGGIPKRTREPYPLPTLDIHPGILDYEMNKYPIDLFQLKNYQSHPIIKAPLSN